MKGTSRANAPKATERRGRSVTMFVSYAHHNKVWMERLRPLLVGLQYDDRARNLVGLDEVSAWHDFELQPGDLWDKEIKDALEKMDIFIPLVSAEFFASWYVMNIEMPKAEQRHRQRKIHVVPILLHDINLREKNAFLHQFNPLPAWDHWWSKYRSHADAHRLIDDGLWKVIEKAIKRNGKQR